MKLEFFCIYKGENWWKTKAILQTVKLHGYENEASLHTEKVIGSQNRIYFKLEFPMVWHETSKLEVLGIFMALFAKWFRSQEKDYDNTRYYCTLHDLNRFFPNLEDTLEPYHKDARSDYFDASWMLPVFTAQGLHYLHQLGFATLAAKAYFDHFNKMPHSNKILSKANHAAIKDLRVKIETRMKELSNYQSQTLEDLTTIYKKNFKNSIFDTNPTLTLDSLFKEVSNEINEYIKNVQTSEISTIKDRVESIMLLAKDKDMDPEDILDHLFKNIHFKSNYDIKRWINGDKGSEFAMNYFCQLIKGLIQNVDDQIIYIWHLGNKLDEEYQISHGIIKYLLSLGNSYSISHKHSYHIRLDKVHFEPKANTTIKQELNSYIFAKVLDLDPIGQITPLKLLIEKFNRDQLSLDFYFKFWVLKILKRTEISFNCHNVLLEAFIEFKPKESELYEIQIKALDDYMLNKNKEERVNYITSKAEQILQTTQNLGKDYLKLSIKLIFDKSILNFRSFHEFLKDAPKLEDKIIEHFRSIFSTPVELYSKIKDILQDSNNSKFSSSEVIRAGRIFFTMDDNDPKYDSVKRGLNNLLDDLKNKRVPLNFVSLLIRKLDSKQEIPYESNQERQKTITSIISAITLEDPPQSMSRRGGCRPCCRTWRVPCLTDCFSPAS
jgi:hypothetical protein